MMELDPKDALRSRLATESFLAQKQRELAEANTRIAERARVLSDEVIERRAEAAIARSEAEKAKHRHVEAMSHLRKAKSETNIAERRLWTSLETIADGFAVFDRDSRVVAANPAFFQPYEDMDCVKLGISYGEMVDIAIEEGLVDPGEMGPRDWAIWMKSRWDHKTIPPVTIRFWSNQFVRITERRTPDGDVVMMGMNITRQIRRQKVLEEARRRAEAANRAKSAFLANMSHEIRTPMNGVLAMAEMMAEDPLTEDQRICLDTIKNSGEALLVIINDVLDYSKIEAQKLSVETRPFDLEAAISEVTTLLMPTAREKGLALVFDYDMFLPTVFEGDKGRIRQILMNLIGNAVKFTKEGYVLVRVVGLPDPRPEHYRLHITVEDTGIGVPPEMREHIFGEFNQVQSEMTREFDGTGLGLAITRRLVALMDGDMWVDSGAESGSVFGFRLTLRKEGPDIEGLRGKFGQRRVVLCDPNRKSREIMMKQMMALGLRPEAVDSAYDEALGQLGPEDLAILCEDRGIQGTVTIGLGPEFGEQSETLSRPVLRDALLGALTRVTRGGRPKPVVPLEADVLTLHAEMSLPQPETPEPAAPVAGPVIAPPDPETDAEDDLPPLVPRAEAVPEPAPEPLDPGTPLPVADTTPEEVLDALATEAPRVPAVAETPRAAVPFDSPTPLAAEVPDAAPPKKRPAYARKVRVLCAEDNKTNRLVLTKLLKSLDIDLEIVENGHEAVEAFKFELPDIVFTDISMPVMDGKAAARAMRLYSKENDLPPVPIIAMTAHAGDTDEREILASGIDYYLTKPLKKDVMIDHILAAAPYDAVPPLSEEDG